MKINLSEAIGKGYYDFWHFKGRYLLVKGSRGSKKSTTAAMKIIYNLMKYPKSNALILRQTFNTHRDSTWKKLQWAAERLGVRDYWDFTVSPLEAVNIKTGQHIYFRGLDDPLKITSIDVSSGIINFVWVEEAYEITSEENFNKIDLSIRGEMPEGYYKQFIFTFNPWSEQTWLKARFFDTPNDENKLAITTTYKCNEWLGPEDIALFEDMKKRNPRRYVVEGEGEWGLNPEGLVFQNWREETFDPIELVKLGYVRRSGMDIGFSDPTAILNTLYDEANKRVFVYQEYYARGKQLEEIANAMEKMELKHQRCYVDAADARAIDYFRRKGFNTYPSIKGAGSVEAGISFLQDLEIIVNPACKNLIAELENFSYIQDPKTGKYTEKTTHEWSHAIDALRYSYCDLYTNKKLKTFDIGLLGL